MYKIEKCPKCNNINISQEEIDIGVGTEYGPAHCETCNWDQETELSKPFKLLKRMDQDD